MSGGVCRVCGGHLDGFLDLGRQPLSDAFRRPDEDSEEFTYRLRVGLCRDCGMVQQTQEVPREKMFHAAYPYSSSGSRTMRAHFAGTARQLLAEHGSGDAPFVAEIGCNDGVMLETVARAGVPHLGFEPSTGVADVARSKGVDVVGEFFDEETARAVARARGAASVIFSANTICHIPYLGSVLAGVDALLADNGVFVFEDPYLGAIVENTAFDQIYDEHFYFFSATAVAALARRHGLELVDVKPLPVHGGEMRYTLARPGSRSPSPEVEALIARERATGFGELSTYTAFAERVAAIRDDLVALLRSLRADGARIAGYGATAKSATMLNYAGLGPETIDYVCDTTPAKQGRLTPGSHIPVVPSERFAEDRPDYTVLLAWNLAEEILAKERDYTATGGRWVRYVPDVHVLGAVDTVGASSSG